MLSFDDSQMDRVYAAARLLPANRRDLFLRSISNILGALRYEPISADVEKAIILTLSCYGVTGGDAFIAHKTNAVHRKAMRRQRWLFAKQEILT